MNAEDALASLPAAIRKADNDAFDQAKSLEGGRLRLRLREVDLAQIIAQATTPDGKKVHSNADARDAALAIALERDDEAKMLRKAVIEAEALLQRVRSTIEYYRAVQANARALILGRSPATVFLDDAGVHG